DIVSTSIDVLYYVNYEAVDDVTPLNQLTWSLNTNASWLNIETITGVLSGTPTTSELGSYWVNVSVGDGDGGWDSHNFTLTVYSEPNHPPEITTKDKLNAAVDVLYSVDYDATDDRTPVDYLQWSVKTNASWLSMHSTTGVLVGTPRLEDVGWYIVNVTVFDGEDGWDYHNFVLTVSTEPIEENNAPVLTNAKMTPSEGDIDTEFTFSVHYYDEDGDTPASIQVVIDGERKTMGLKAGENASDGIYEYSIKLSEGNHTYYFTASDGEDAIDTDTFITSNIDKVGKASQDQSLWDWLIWVVIIVIILIVVAVLFVYKKRKEEKIPTVKAELLSAPPEHMALPSVTAAEEGASPLPSPVVVAEQFPTPKAPTPSLAPPPTKPVPQLPQATLSKTQKLNLLKERLLRGEIDLETYKELKVEIESSTGGEVPEGEVEDISTIDEQPPTEPIAAPPATTPQAEQPPTPPVEPQVVAQPLPVPTPQVEQPSQPQVEAQ
ncbi:MAG: hypothetical protein KAJ51_04335, partial [Thermoplasmata archaeon]|nr:hypothetical protein [Thermoplasmata archaeon]